MENHQSNDKPEYVGETEKITHPGQIAGLVSRMHEERAHLNVTIPGTRGIYNTAVVRVNPASGHFFMDELHPSDGHDHFLHAKKLLAFTRLKGVELSFACHLGNVTVENGLSLYEIPLPDLINYRQRRAAYRVHVGAGLAVPVVLRDRDMQRLEGLLCDISAGGIGAKIKGKHAAAAEEGMIIPECEIQLPSGDTIACALEVRFISPPDAQGNVRIGGKFRALDKSQEKIVERFVVALERELLRKRPKD
jgi:c-di-GMP-binding flagellar brake protein YcgR